MNPIPKVEVRANVPISLIARSWAAVLTWQGELAINSCHSQVNIDLETGVLQFLVHHYLSLWLKDWVSGWLNMAFSLGSSV